MDFEDGQYYNREERLERPVYIYTLGLITGLGLCLGCETSACEEASQQAFGTRYVYILKARSNIILTTTIFIRLRYRPGVVWSTTYPWLFLVT